MRKKLSHLFPTLVRDPLGPWTGKTTVPIYILRKCTTSMYEVILPKKIKFHALEKSAILLFLKNGHGRR